MDIAELQSKSIVDLYGLAQEMELASFNGLGKQSLIYRILQTTATHDEEMLAEGVLDIAPDGHGFLRSTTYNYLAGPDDIYVSPTQIKELHLQRGDSVVGQVRAPRNGERFFALSKVEGINYEEPEAAVSRTAFDRLTPLYPNEQLRMESNPADCTTRIIDLMAPVGKGQRGLIVAPPKAGKTIILKSIAAAIAANHPEVVLMVLLVDERPEEVTDMKRWVDGDVISSTFDEKAQRHAVVSDMVMEKGKRLVEQGHDVVILLDSLTRLARAYNTLAPKSGRILSGGVDASAMQKPRRFFGAARNVEEGGSLTIIATCLIETGSRMDDVIFEEFKGTGNMEMVLDRDLSDRRIFPAINVHKTGTRKEDLLLDEAALNRVWILRKYLADLNAIEAMDFLIDRLSKSPDNQTFLKSMSV
ncbi:MAG: transcription termination factor Rho [Gemmatimonadetes bacterium]|nr:transcription termination factor Rho [Gemmatimonadota bacterium]